jgi:hypothetical protein
MTGRNARRVASYDVATLIIVASLLLFAWTHRHALSVAGFAEDLSHVQWLVKAQQSGELAERVWATMIGPLWGPGSSMWRPLAFASLAFDASVFGARSGLWHITNLVLHVIAACGVAALAWLWMRSRWAVAAAFATMLLHPYSAEVTLWLVGRFDGWATATIALALLAMWRNRGFDRWWVFALCSSVCAYASKESALILFPATVMLAVARYANEVEHVATFMDEAQWSARNFAPSVLRALRVAMPIIAMQCLLAALYLMVRWWLVGTTSTDVYGTATVASAEFFARLGAHLKVFASLASYSRLAASVAALLLVCALLIALRERRWSLLGFVAVWIAIVFAGAALHFDGGSLRSYRIYYLALIAVALLMAAAAAYWARRSSTQTAIAIGVWCIALALWQNAVNRPWWAASKEIESTARAIATEIPKIPATDYALVLLPDWIDAVPIFLNAQSSIVTIASERTPGVNGLDRVVAFLPFQFDEWHRLMGEDVVAKLTTRSDAPRQPTRFYCKQIGSDQLSFLGVWPLGTPAEWREKWAIAVRANCPSLKL